MRTGLDESWRAFLTWAFEHGKQFGTEVVFTYGPWGFLLEPRGGFRAYPWQVLGRMVLAISASLGTALLGVSWIRPRLARWIWGATLVALAEPTMLVPVLLFLCTMPSVGVFRWKTPALMLVALGAGLAACTKFTVFLVIAGLLPVLLLRKRNLAVVATVVASFFFFWFLAGQGTSGVPAFIRQSMEVSSGYTSAMVAGHPLIEVPLALLVCGLPLLLILRMLPPLTLENIGRLGWFAAFEFLVFRHSLIRNDAAHTYLSLLTVGIPILILLVPLSGELAIARQTTYRVCLLGAFVVALSSSASAVSARVKLFIESVRLFPVYALNLKSLGSREHAVPTDTGGSVDMFPADISYPLQNGLTLRNRPVIQAYSAYTRRLCEINAAFLEGRSAPEEIYFRVSPIDERYPTMEDSLAWRSLITHYAPYSVSDEYLVLKKRERPASYELKLILDRTIRGNEVLEIPDVHGGLIWAELDAQRSVAGRLMDLFYRKPKLMMTVETIHRSQDFTLLDETASAGFLLSPYMENGVSLLELFHPESDRFYSENVRRMSIRYAKPASTGYSPDFKIRLYSLVIATSPQVLPGHLLRDLSRTFRSERPAGAIEFRPELTFNDGELRLVAGSPSTGWIPLPAGNNLHLSYGLDGERSTCSGRVSFRILTADGAGAGKRLLWQENGQSNSGEDWSAEARIKLPTAVEPLSRLYFETESGERSCGAEGAYWSDLRVVP